VAAYKFRVPQPGPSAINAATRLCAVYGFPIRHSASPAMHNAAFTALGLNWRYLACEVHPGDLRAAIAGARAMGFAGLNLTVPHKLLAFKLLARSIRRQKSGARSIPSVLNLPAPVSGGKSARSDSTRTPTPSSPRCARI